MKAKKFLSTLLIFLIPSCSPTLLGQAVSTPGHKVEFRISGPSYYSILLTIRKPDGGTTQEVTTVSQLRKIGRDGKTAVLTFTYAPRTFAYLTIQNQESSGSFTVKIFVDGKLIQESDSTAGYGTATVSSTMPNN